MTNISEHQYHAMCNEAVRALVDAWGYEKYQEWYELNILPLNGKIFWDYHSFYTYLKAELDGLYQLYDKTFGGNDYAELQKEQTELRGAI